MHTDTRVQLRMGVTMFSAAELNILRTFRNFRVAPGQMLCFHGPDLRRYQTALQKLTREELLVKERFRGGYSLTRAGYAAMERCA